MNTDSLAWLTEQQFGTDDPEIPEDSFDGHFSNALISLRGVRFLDCESDGGQMQKMVAIPIREMLSIVARLDACYSHYRDALGELAEERYGYEALNIKYPSGLPAPRSWKLADSEFEEGLEPEDYR